MWKACRRGPCNHSSRYFDYHRLPAGALIVEGTAVSPVSFRSVHSAGWDGISFETGASGVLNHCEIIDAGRGGTALTGRSGVFTSQSLTIRDLGDTATGISLAGAGDTTCAAHSSDYAPEDWVIQLNELLRLIQFFNTGGYHVSAGTEDNFGPGLL